MVVNIAKQNITFRLGDMNLDWLRRNGRPLAQQLRDDLQTLRGLMEVSVSPTGKHMTIREAFELVASMRGSG